VLNEALCDTDYDVAIFHKLIGKSVDTLWEEYKAEIEKREPKHGSEDNAQVPLS
jgi:hypothetical protein